MPANKRWNVNRKPNVEPKKAAKPKAPKKVEAPKKEEFPSEWQRPEADATTTPGEIASPIEWIASWPAPIAEKTPNYGQIVGSWSRTNVVAPKWRIRFEAQQASVPMFMLPDDIRRYLTNKWWWSGVRKKSKERLEKHHADMEMIAKLKAFLSGRL